MTDAAATPLEPRAPGEPGAIEPAPGEPSPPIIPADLDAALAFVRHGESEWVAEGRFQGQGDPPLSDVGRRQALFAKAAAHQTMVASWPYGQTRPSGVDSH